jgi:hypothetical protein
MSCGAQFATGFTKVITGSGAALSGGQPYSFFIAELFKIVDGKINRIEALATPVPYGMSTGWVER